MGKIKFGLIGLILVLLWLPLYKTFRFVEEKRVAINSEINYQAVKNQGQPEQKLPGNSQFNSLVQSKEPPYQLPTIWEIILAYFSYYLAPLGGLLLGFLGLFKDKRWGKIFAVLSIIGALYIVYNFLLLAVAFRMV